MGVVAVPGGGASATLSGTGLTPANLTIAAASKDFGTHATGTTSPAQAFTVTNTGAVPSGTIATSVTGADAAQFTKSADNCNGQTLAAGASCTVNGAFAPSTTGAKSASLQATASPGGTASAALSATGATPANLTISPSPHGFGDRVNNTTSPAQPFTVTNTGGVPSGSITTSLTGTNSDQFTKAPDTCNGQTLASGASCTVDGAFAPTSSGAKSASLQASATPGGTASASLTGTGQTPANLTIAPTSYNFGNVLQGTNSPTQQFTLTNTGQQSAQISSFSLSGIPRFDFTGSACPATLAGGASCTIGVRFQPLASDTGTFTGTLTVNGTVGGSPSASLSGTAVTTPADLRIAITSTGVGQPPDGDFSSSDSFAYGTAGVGTLATVVVWIKNFGAADALVSNSPVPIARTNTNTVIHQASTDCNINETLPANAPLTFTDTRIVGGTASACSIGLQFQMDQSTAGQPFSGSFTITGTPGGSITATVNGDVVPPPP